MSDIVDIVMQPIDPQTIGGIRDGDGDCLVESLDVYEKSPS